MRKLSLILSLIFVIGTLSGCGQSGPSFRRYSPLKSLVLGTNAREHRMADGIYQLVVANIVDKNEINPLHMMLYFAAELTLENNYQSFVLLPHDEKPYQEADIKKLRKRVYSGEFNEINKKPAIRVKTTTRCNAICTKSYKSKAIIVMLKGDETKKARSLDAKKVYERFKAFVPVPPKA